MATCALAPSLSPSFPLSLPLSLPPSLPLSLRYLNREKVTAGDSYIFWYSWGPRAEQEVDKRELLALVAEVTHHINCCTLSVMLDTPPSLPLLLRSMVVTCHNGRDSF